MRIAIIGSGVAGLTTGVILLEMGHQVTIYARDLPPNVTSNAACAIFIPIWTKGNELQPSNYEALLEKWARLSWDKWQKLNKLGEKEYGIYWIRNHELFKSREDVPEHLNYLKDLLPDFEATYDSSLPDDFTYRWSFNTFVIEMPTYLPRLLQEFQDNGGSLVVYEFKSLMDVMNLQETIIVNCTGLGAKTLFNDTSLEGIKGQLLLHEPVQLDFAIGMDTFSIIPRKDALTLGVLFQREGEYSDPLPSEENLRKIWDGLRVVLEKRDGIVSIPPELTISPEKIFGMLSGLRPLRHKGIRLEQEHVNEKLIIHNYGHGGAGVGLSWGCAYEVANLLQSLQDSLE